MGDGQCLENADVVASRKQRKVRMPKDVNVITAKWVFGWKTDANGLITKAKARLVARGFGQRYAQ